MTEGRLRWLGSTLLALSLLASAVGLLLADLRPVQAQTRENVLDSASAGTSVTVSGALKCVQSTSGVTVELYNASLTFHAVCAAPSGSGAAVGVHFHSSTTETDLERFAEASGIWGMYRTGGGVDAETVFLDRPATSGLRTVDWARHGSLSTTQPR